MTTYSLGSSSNEQSRLFLQQEIYGDTNDITFSSGDTICEFGCGPGANLWIAKQIHPGKYIGFDLQMAHVESARKAAVKMGLTNAELRCEDAAACSLENDSVDGAFCRFVLIHQPNPQKILQEMCRVTRNRGRLIIIEPHDPGYYLGPGKEHLLRCFQARNRFAYGDGKGSPDVAVNLHGHLLKLPVTDVRIRPHVISIPGTEREKYENFVVNLLGLIEPVVDELISSGMISSNDWANAQLEAKIITADLFLTETIWKAEAVVSK